MYTYCTTKATEVALAVALQAIDHSDELNNMVFLIIGLFCLRVWNVGQLYELLSELIVRLLCFWC